MVIARDIYVPNQLILVVRSPAVQGMGRSRQHLKVVLGPIIEWVVVLLKWQAEVRNRSHGLNGKKSLKML